MAFNANNATNVVTTPVRDMLRALWIGIIVLLIANVVMWGFNITNLKGVVIPIALIGSLLIAMVGFRATNVVGFGIFGAIIGALKDRDISQGAVTGLTWLTEIVVALGLGFVLSAFTLMTWSFQHSPGAFWILFFGITLVLLVQQHYKIKTTWAPKVITAYAVFCILIGGWTTFGGAYTGKVADIKTGEPLYMMDPITRNIISGIEPADCRPKVKKDGKWYQYGHLDEKGALFDYTNKGTCWSPENPGVRAVPLVGEDARTRNPSALTAATVDSFTEAADALSLPDWARNWVVWIIAIIAVALIITWLRKRKGGRRDEYSIGILPGLALLAAVVLILFPLSEMVMSFSGGTDRIGQIGRAFTGGVQCTDPDDLKDVYISESGRTITVCPDEGQYFLFVKKGEFLAPPKFSDSFKGKHPDALKNRSWGSFITIDAPGTYAGSIPGAYRITSLTHPNPDKMEWGTKSGLDHIQLYVNAYKSPQF